MKLLFGSIVLGLVVTLILAGITAGVGSFISYLADISPWYALIFFIGLVWAAIIYFGQR